MAWRCPVRDPLTDTRQHCAPIPKADLANRCLRQSERPTGRDPRSRRLPIWRAGTATQAPGHVRPRRAQRRRDRQGVQDHPATIYRALDHATIGKGQRTASHEPSAGRPACGRRISFQWSHGPIQRPLWRLLTRFLPTPQGPRVHHAIERPGVPGQIRRGVIPVPRVLRRTVGLRRRLGQPFARRHRTCTPQFLGRTRSLLTNPPR
jgi:hypothetical protein